MSDLTGRISEAWSPQSRAAALEARRSKVSAFGDTLSAARSVRALQAKGPASDVDVDALHRLPDYGKVKTHDGIEVQWIPKSPGRYGTGEKTAMDGYGLTADGYDHGFVKNAEDVPGAVAAIRAKRASRG